MFEFINGFMNAFASNPGTMGMETVKIVVIMAVFSIAFIKLCK